MVQHMFNTFISPKAALSATCSRRPPPSHKTTHTQVAVFGFCDIRRFTDTTEVLQEGVMEFVNVIAHLVHGAVAARGGAANKNIGDAFLLVSAPMCAGLDAAAAKDTATTWP